MPEALDLLVVCVDAGLSLEDGLSRVVSELRASRPALADELALTSADLRILPSRDQALAKMSERVDLASIRSVTTTLAQTLRYGTPLAQALRVIATEMRNDALIQMEQRANQLPALLTDSIDVIDHADDISDRRRAGSDPDHGHFSAVGRMSITLG